MLAKQINTVVVASLLLFSAVAKGEVITFEQFDVGDGLTEINSFYSPLGIHFLTEGGAGTIQSVGGNKVFGAFTPNANLFDILINFDYVVDRVSADFLDNGGANGTFSVLEGYNVNKTPGSDVSGFLFVVFGDANLNLSYAWPGPGNSQIRTLHLSQDLASNEFVTVDNIRFSRLAVPDSFQVTRGTYVSGSIFELAESDNLDLSIRRRTSDILSRTEFQVKSTSPTATPTSFEFKLEGSVFARSNVVQTIELFDYVAAAWELVDTTNAARSPAPDSVVTVAATGDLSRFVESGTMCIGARVRYKSDSPRLRFASNTDQAIWTIE